MSSYRPDDLTAASAIASWRTLVPSLGTLGLEVLAEELERPTGILIKRTTITHRPGYDGSFLQCEPAAGCALGLTAWKSFGFATVDQVVNWALKFFNRDPERY